MENVCRSRPWSPTGMTIYGVPICGGPLCHCRFPVMLGVILVPILGAMLCCCDACGVEFQVNTHWTDDQAEPRVAMDEAGNFVVVWDSLNQDGNFRGIYGQRFDANGLKLGDEFRVNTTTVGNQKTPGVSMNAAGDFIVAWSSPDGSLEGIFARQYDSDGVPLTPEFRVNAHTESRQLRPDVALHDSGAFVVVWESDLDPDPDAHNAMWHAVGRAYDIGGDALGGEFIVSQELQGHKPSVAMDDNGDFVVAFERNSDFEYYLQTRTFSADGIPKGRATTISGDLGAVGSPRIAMNGAGEYVIASSSNPGDFIHNDIHVQSFAADGTPAGAEFIANTTLPGYQGSQSIALNDQGELLVAWEDRERGGVFAQAYDGNRMPIGGEFQLSTYVNQQDFAFSTTDVAINNSGRYVAVWQSEGQDGDKGGIFARIGMIPEPTAGSLVLAGAIFLLPTGRRRRH
jgi:hypothetical protein